MIPGTPHRPPRLVFALCALLLATTTLHGGDWTNNGGNAARNGLSDEIGSSASACSQCDRRASRRAASPMDRRSCASTWTPAPSSGRATSRSSPVTGRPGSPATATASVRRVSAADGSTLWDVPRVCNVTSSCGVAVFSGGVYVAEPAPGFMNVIRKLALATGASLYETPPVPGFTLQNTPFVGPDGTLYLSRTQNNPATDFLYAWEDTGTALAPGGPWRQGRSRAG